MIRLLGMFMFFVCLQNVLDSIGYDNKLIKNIVSVAIVFTTVLYIFVYASSYPYLG